MPMGSCCKNDKVCGSELFPTCCSDTEVCVNKTTCCLTEKPYLDANGDCVQSTDDSHCTKDGETCDTATGTCFSSSIACGSETCPQGWSYVKLDGEDSCYNSEKLTACGRRFCKKTQNLFFYTFGCKV